MGLQNFIDRKNVYELHFITCKESHSKPVFSFLQMYKQMWSSRGVLTKYVAFLWVEDGQPCFSEGQKKKKGGIKE